MTNLRLQWHKFDKKYVTEIHWRRRASPGGGVAVRRAVPATGAAAATAAARAAGLATAVCVVLGVDGRCWRSGAASCAVAAGSGALERGLR